MVAKAAMIVGQVLADVVLPFLRTPYNYDRDKASNDHAVVPVGESLTVQSMSEDADINVMMRRYGLTGKLPENPRLPSYGDFSGISDFRSALEAVKVAEEAFAELTAEVRARFQNDPQMLLEFCEDARNLEEARKLGLLKPVEAPAVPVPAPAVAPAAVVSANVVAAPQGAPTK